jgi:dolichol kinase
MENFPGRGVLFYTIGAFLALLLFQTEVAYAAIIMLSTGDAVSNLVGKHFGMIKTKLNPDKYIEGTLAGILVSVPVAYFFTHNFTASVVASCVAMVLELPNIKIFGFEIDDNLLIPLGAGVALSLFV